MSTSVTVATDEGVRAEQLRLVLEGVAQSVAVGFLVSTRAAEILLI